MGVTPPKGLGAAKDQGIFRLSSGEMGVIKGLDLSKMVEGKGVSVGLWTFMTMAEKISWLNDTVGLVTFEALDPMWQEFNIAIYEWKLP
jgi:hypothetical protein